MSSNEITNLNNRINDLNKNFESLKLELLESRNHQKIVEIEFFGSRELNKSGFIAEMRLVVEKMNNGIEETKSMLYAIDKREAENDRELIDLIEKESLLKKKVSENSDSISKINSKIFKAASIFAAINTAIIFLFKFKIFGK